MNRAAKTAARSILAAAGAVVLSAVVGGCAEGHNYVHADQAPLPSVLATEGPSPSPAASGSALPTNTASASPTIAATGPCASPTDPVLKLACTYEPDPPIPPVGWTGPGSFGTILAAAPGVDWRFRSAGQLNAKTSCFPVSFVLKVVGGPADHVYTVLVEWGYFDAQTQKTTNVAQTSSKLPPLSPGQTYTANIESCVPPSVISQTEGLTLSGYGVQ